MKLNKSLMKQHNLTDRPQDLTGDTQHVAGELWNHRRRRSRVFPSTRALTCSDRRLAARGRRVIQSLIGDLFAQAGVVGGGADHSTRGRARSPAQLNTYGCGETPANLSPSPRRIWNGVLLTTSRINAENVY